MAYKDRSGITIIELQDVLPDGTSPVVPEGATVEKVVERAVVRRFKDSLRVVDGSTAGLVGVKFWVVIDLGDPNSKGRWRYTDNYDRVAIRDRYTTATVAEGQEIHDVEKETGGVALPDKYYSMIDVVEACADLCTFSRIHET